MLPPFTSEGLLPPGNYDLTFEQLKNSALVAGLKEEYPNWDSKWRMRLVNSLEILVGQLWQVGIPDPICIGGSFVEDRYHPNDIDGYFYCCDQREFLTGELQRKLNELDPLKAWDWNPKSRTSDARGKRQYPLWHKYSVDLFPNFGQPTGVFNLAGEPMDFYSLMRWSDRVKCNRGVIQLRRSL